MKNLIVASAVAATALAGGPDPIPEFSAICHDDNTLSIYFPFSKTAEILELNYGTCSLSSAGVSNTAQAGDFSFNVTLDMALCGMDDSTAALEYLQVADLRVGRSSVDITTGVTTELSFATFDLDSKCSVTEEYEIEFSYGNLTVVEDTLTEIDGNATVSFTIEAYDFTFTTSGFSHSTVAGDTIYLGLTVTSSGFNYAQREFAPAHCTIQDSVNGYSYTLFNAEIAGGCSNTDVDLTVAYDSSDNMWQFSHILFLLGDTDESTFVLKCKVLVCDIDAVSACDDIKTECGI